MIEYETKPVELKHMKAFICDKCGKRITADEAHGMEFQERYSIRFTGGFSSVFGDMNNVSCDLCQHCLMDLIGGFCRYNDEEYI